jgi:hypothetical protein
MTGVRELVERLKSRREPALLVPGTLWDAELDREIERAIPDDAPEELRSVKSALHLWNDNLKRAHELAQEIETRTGSYLHGVMHRREPDYGNSKYWFRRVGEHEAFPAVREAALELSGGSPLRKAIEASPAWDPFRMVDWCEEAAGKDPKDLLVAFLRALQARELAQLADYCVGLVRR